MGFSFKPLTDKVKNFFFRETTVEEELDIIKAEKRPALFDLIGQKEANGNYNAFFGNAANQELNFTGMSVSDVRKWQDDFVRKGSKSSAVGKYQIIRKTMDSLIDEMELKGNEKFDEDLQDRMAETLANRRGYSKWKSGSLSDEKFANNLAKEWASFPVVSGPKRGRSYYAGDGLNKALISPEEVFNALQKENRFGKEA